MEEADWQELERLLEEAELEERTRKKIRSIAEDKCGEEVKFDGHGLGDTGTRALALALKGTTAVKVLQLDHNQIGDAGARALAKEGLKHVPSLQRLALELTQIGDDGAQALAEEGLKHVPSLEILVLYGNRIGDAGARALAQEGLKHVPSLRHLVLHDNPIWDAGARALVEEGLKHVPSLRELTLLHNGLTEGGVVPLLKCLQANPSQCRIKVKENGLTDSVPVARAYATLRHLHPGSEFFFVSWEGYAEGFGPTAQAAYKQQLDLLELLETGSVPLDTAKVFVCGDYGIGKTTLVTTLEKQRHLEPGQQPPDEPTRPDERTAGIHVRPLQLTLAADDGTGATTANFQVYDFGGQTAYHVIHTLLVSDHNAAFVVCADLSKSKDEAKASIKRWLRFLCTRLQQSVEAITQEAGEQQQDKRPHVVLVGTKADKPHESTKPDAATGKLRWSRTFVKRLRSTFGNIVNITGDSILPVNCFRNQDPGFGQLRSKLLDHWHWLREKRVLVPKVVEEVGKQLKRVRKESETPMTKDELLQLLVEVIPQFAGVQDSTETRELFDATLRYLHVRGDVLWFSDNPALSRYVFVAPNWLLNDVMGRALAPDGVNCDGIAPENGVVAYIDIDVAFDEYGIPADLVIDVLQHSHLCFELPLNKSGQRQFMLPSRLEDEVQDIATVWSQEPGWSLYAGRRLLIEHNAFSLPPSLFPYLQTKLYESFGETLQLWPNAFKLRAAAIDCFGLMRSDREIDVWVRATTDGADNARACLDQVFQGIEVQLRGIPYEIHAVSVKQLKQHHHHPASYELAPLLKKCATEYAISSFHPASDPVDEKVGELLLLNQTPTEHARDMPWHAAGYEWWHGQWRLDDAFDQQLQWAGPGQSKVYIAPLPASSNLHQWIASQVNTGHGVTLSRVEVVKSATMLGAFKFRVQQMAERRGETNAANPFNQDYWTARPGKAAMRDRLKRQFCNRDAQHVNVLPLWHGCSEAVVNGIAAAGTANLSGPTDPGFFGTGIYLSQQASYAAAYASKLAVGQWAPPNSNGEHVLLLCAVSVGLAYPITRQEDYEPGATPCKFYGQKLHRGCDTHYAQVTAASGFQATDTPGTFNFEEVVVNQEAQVLPFAKVYVKVNWSKLKNCLLNHPP